MRINVTANFGTEKNRVYLYQLSEYLRTALSEIGEALDGEGVTVDTMQTVSASLGEMASNLGSLYEERNPSTPTVREGHGPLPPETQGGAITIKSAQTSGAFYEFSWLLQELLSITEGTFTVRITKGTDGFRVLFDFSPAVVRFDTDVPIEVPDYDRENRSDDDADTYLDRAIWSQENAESSFPDLLLRLNSELPASDPTGDQFKESMASVYTEGGVTFRISRVGSCVSLAVDRETDSVTPIRTLVSARASQ